MPFTFAHPIAAAPIWLGSKRKLDLPSLIIGSMIPDIEYFLSLQPVKTIGHTFTGILLQGIPYSIALLLISRYILMRPCLALLPPRLARHLPLPTSYFSLKSLYLLNVIGSIIIGASSHLIWDFFIHRTKSVVNHSQRIQAHFSEASMYQLFHLGSTAIGLIAIVIWLLKWLDRTEYRHQIETLTPNWRGIAAIAIVLPAFGLAIVAIEANHVVGETALEVFVRALIGCISGTFVGLCLYSIGFWICEKFKPGSTTI
ncbi:DUF4184 family protein [Chamaesiphon sp. OTE_20_metabat_361]|uniref:DUF4184 family protein n=1 Tax=Chamaesiphon sp. OTE_20_metabat_361 TaxID=2964689 RepID=UPI002869FE6B|nr:DUF4184 family protein [Chamaesiphon sp. OTE_20_metabat_361]